DRHVFHGGEASSSQLTLIDSAGSGVDLRAAEDTLRSDAPSAVTVRVGHSLYVVAKDGSGAALAGQTLTVHDSSGQTFTAVTDENGVARLELTDAMLTHAADDASHVMNEVVHTGHLVRLEGYPDVALPLDVSQNESSPLPLTFGSVPEPEPDGPLIVVNQAWINQNISEGALFLDQADKTYRFETDFHAAGTAVFVMASGITIDLNGHTITFGSNDRDG